jgi:methionine-R-sulfoxide reductase
MTHSHTFRILLSILVVAFVVYHYYPQLLRKPEPNAVMFSATASSSLSARSKLSPEAYRVMYQSGTERPYTSLLLEEHRGGTYVSADTGRPLFRSEDKFDSGTGWPSFVKPITPDAVVYNVDDTLGETRTEVLAGDTHAHLGHVFDDGPKDRGGKRYCMNGVALRFIPDTPDQ